MATNAKLIVLTIIAVGLLIGLITGRVEGEAWGLLGLIVGYLTGNGVAAKQGKTAMPAIYPREDDDA